MKIVRSSEYSRQSMGAVISLYSLVIILCKLCGVIVIPNLIIMWLSKIENIVIIFFLLLKVFILLFQIH